MKTIIKYLTEENSHALYEKIFLLVIFVVCLAVVSIMTIFIVWNGLVTLFSDIPVWGILTIVLYVGYIFLTSCVYNSIKEDVTIND